MDNQPQGECMHPLALGKGKRFADKAAQALALGVVPTLDMAGLVIAFATATVGAPWEDLPASQLEVAAGSPAAVLGRDALAQRPGTLRRAVTHKLSGDLTRLATAREPSPAGVGLRADKAPEFVQLSHLAGRCRQGRLVQRRANLGFSPSQREIVRRATPEPRSAARRLRRSVATARRTSFCAPGQSPGSWGAAPGTLHRPGGGTAGGHRRFCRS